MGQAKIRGTYEERVKMAKNKPVIEKAVDLQMKHHRRKGITISLITALALVDIGWPA